MTSIEFPWLGIGRESRQRDINLSVAAACVALIGDAAHLMSLFNGEDAGLAVADTADLAEAPTPTDPYAAATFEESMAARADKAATGAAAGLERRMWPEEAAPMLAYYRERAAA